MAVLYGQEYLHNISDQNPRRPNWAKNIISVLECAGLTHLWERQESMPYSLFRHLKFTLSSLYERLWLDRINDPSKSPKLRTYIRFKQKFVMESYLISCLNYSHRKSFTKLRISAHPLCIETDRYKTPKVPADKRYCLLCKNHQVETEQHFLLSCPSLSDIRSDFLDSLRFFVDLDSLSADELFNLLMSYNSGDPEISKVVIRCVYTLFEKRKTILESDATWKLVTSCGRGRSWVYNLTYELSPIRQLYIRGPTALHCVLTTVCTFCLVFL